MNQMFMNSDTSMAVLTSWPGTSCPDDPANTDPCGLPLSNEHMADSRDKINQREYVSESRRSFLLGRPG